MKENDCSYLNGRTSRNSKHDIISHVFIQSLIYICFVQTIETKGVIIISKYIEYHSKKIYKILDLNKQI